MIISKSMNFPNFSPPPRRARLTALRERKRPQWFIRIKVHGGQTFTCGPASAAAGLMQRFIIVFIFLNIVPATAGRPQSQTLAHVHLAPHLWDFWCSKPGDCSTHATEMLK